MVVIVAGYTLFVMSQHIVTFTFANQRFGEVCFTQHAYYSARTILTRCCTMCHCNEHKIIIFNYNQRSKLGDWSKTQHSTLRQSSSKLQKYPATRSVE